MRKNPLSYPQAFKIATHQEDESFGTDLVTAISAAGGRARLLNLDTPDLVEEWSDFLLLRDLIMLLSPAALRSPKFRSFLYRAWYHQAHIDPPAILLLVLVAPPEGIEDVPWLKELPLIATSDGHPYGPEEAIKQTLKALGMMPADPPPVDFSSEALLLQAKVLWRVGKAGEALTSLQMIVKKSPASFRGWYSLGALLGTMPGREEDALAAFEQALILEPDAVNAWGWKAELLKQLNRSREARAAYECALACDTKRILSWEDRAWILRYELERYDEALLAYEQIARQYPEETFIYFDMGEVLDKQGRFEEAIAAYNNHISRHPEDGDALYNRARALGELNRYEEALSSLGQAIHAYEADSATDRLELADAWHNQAVALYELDRCAEAISAVDRTLEIFGREDAHAANTWYLRGLILQETQMYEEALQAFDHALAFHSSQAPEKDQIWKRKAEVLRALGRDAGSQDAEGHMQ